MPAYDPNMFFNRTRVVQQAARDVGDTFSRLAQMQQEKERLEAAEIEAKRQEANDPINILRMMQMGQQVSPEQEAIAQVYTRTKINPVTGEPLFPQVGAQRQVPAQQVRAPIQQAAESPEPQMGRVSMEGLSPKGRMEAEKANIALEKEAREQEFAKTKQNKEAVIKSKELVRLAKKLKMHKGLDSAVGVIQGRISKDSPWNSDVGSFNSLESQVLGGTFLEARDALKGAGAVTDFEGMKGQEAISRINRLQGEEGYKDAVDEFIKVTENGIARAEGRKPPHDFSEEEAAWRKSEGQVEGVPSNYKLIGKSGGKDVYEAPDGKQFIME